MKLLFLILLPFATFSQSFHPSAGLLSSPRNSYGLTAGVLHTVGRNYSAGLLAEVAYQTYNRRTPLALVIANQFQTDREGVNYMAVLNIGPTIKPHGAYIEAGVGIKGRYFNLMGTEARMVLSVGYRKAYMPRINETHEDRGEVLMRDGVVFRVGWEF